MSNTGLKVVAGISASGKGTAVRALRELHPEIYRAATYTTRPPRPDEEQRGHYRFVNPEEFAELIRNNELFEYQTVWGYQYGLPMSELTEAKHLQQPVLLELDIRGVNQLLRSYPDTKVVFLFCNPQEQEKRLVERGASVETIPDRLKGSVEELRQAHLLAEEFPNNFFLIDNSNQNADVTVKMVNKKLFE